MPIPERIKLVDEIWDSINFSPEAVKISPEQMAELERRIEDHRLNPEKTIPWERVKAEALARK